MLQNHPRRLGFLTLSFSLTPLHMVIYLRSFHDLSLYTLIHQNPNCLV